MKVVYKARLLPDNGPSYIVSDLTDYLDGKGMDHIEGRPYHKHPGQNRTLVSVTEKSDTAVKYYLPSDLVQRIGQFMDYYNHVRDFGFQPSSRPVGLTLRSEPLQLSRLQIRKHQPLP